MTQTDTKALNRVAVASQNRKEIDLHFGQAEEFHVYDITGGEPVFVETRLVDDYSQGGADEDKRAVIVRALSDCCALFAARIGEGPRARLAAAGIASVADYAEQPVVESLRSWAAKLSPPM